MRVTLVLAVLGLALLSVGIGACGGSTKAGDTITGATSGQAVAASPPSSTVAVTRTVPPPARGVYLNDGDRDPLGDEDGDNSKDDDNDPQLDYQQETNNSYHDSDDTHILSVYGKPAASAVRDAVTKVVDRYYAAITADDGALACSLALPILATATPLDAGKLGPDYLHGAKTCTQVMSLLSKHFRTQLRTPVVVTGVRNNGEDALAELGSKTMPAGWITLQSEHGTWRIAQLFGGPLE
ncbi:MAG TPA: hypothetical protein VK730_04640 [Solirubrobacteraceae bacterium]|jgi:hypothetical protein|nr:hypothetical protein [Solirubrobacteraceae bacterium]